MKNFWRFSGNEKKYIDQLFRYGFKQKKGAFSSRLEKLWSKYHKMNYSICINSCTSALHVAFKALGIGKNDEVIVPSLTPIMCGTSVSFCNAIPVYADVDHDNFLIDPIDIEKKITKRTKAILAVHMYSGICNLKVLKKICKKYNLFLVEDCAEAVGAKDENGNLTGTIGDISCWSFQAAKQLTSGDGGILSTNNASLGKRIRQFSNLGFTTLTADSNQIVVSKDKRQNPNYNRFIEIGFNYRMNEFTAAIALAQTEKLDFFVKKRREMGLSFEKVLKKNKFLIPQKINSKSHSSYYTFAVRLKNNNQKKFKWSEFREKFLEFGGDGIYAAWKTVNNEPCFADVRKNGLFKFSLNEKFL